MRSLFFLMVAMLFSGCSGLFISEQEERMMTVPLKNRSELEELTFLNKEFARMNAALFGLNRQMEAVLVCLRERSEEQKVAVQDKK